MDHDRRRRRDRSSRCPFIKVPVHQGARSSRCPFLKLPVHQEVPIGHREEDEDDAQTSPSSAKMRRPCKNTRQHNACGRRAALAALGQPIVMMNLMICHNLHDGKTPELREDLISLGTRLEMPEPRRTRGLSTKPLSRPLVRG